ncbi:MAG: hypothetical protein ABGZ17_08000 [Planctomycetaceae bacterium]
MYFRRAVSISATLFVLHFSVALAFWLYVLVMIDVDSTVAPNHTFDLSVCIGLLAMSIASLAASLRRAFYWSVALLGVVLCASAILFVRDISQHRYQLFAMELDQGTIIITEH